MRQLRISYATIVRGCFTRHCYYTSRISDVRGWWGSDIKLRRDRKTVRFFPLLFIFFFLHNASCY